VALQLRYLQTLTHIAAEKNRWIQIYERLQLKENFFNRNFIYS
jgi:hypothetical protein